MACSSDFVQYIVDQCSGAGEIAVKKMMGDYCIYCDGILFGLICDNNLYVKVTESGKALLKEIILRPPYEESNEIIGTCPCAFLREPIQPRPQRRYSGYYQ